MWSHDSHVTSSRTVCGPPVHPEVLSDQYWDMRLSGPTTCLCFLFLLSALLTRVVCVHALLVFTSVSLPRWLLLPVLLQDPAGHACVTAATALSEGRESHKDNVLDLAADMVKRVPN